MARTYGEPWADCAICGFTSPQSALQRHYLTGLLVDARCVDDPGAAELRQWSQRPVESGMATMQPAAGLGAEELDTSGYGESLYGLAPYGE